MVAVLLPIVFNLILVLSIDQIIEFWRGTLVFWVGKLDFGAEVHMRAFDLAYFDLWVPAIFVEGKLPSPTTWWITAGTCVIVFLLTYLIKPNKGLPFIYLLRAIILLQSAALIYFAFIPASFPHPLEDYVTSNLFVGIMFIALIPWLLGGTYYLFEFSLVKKIALTILIMGFFIVALPLQYLLHACLIAHGSLLFMPVLYLVFGSYIDVLAFIALFSYGLSFKWQ